MTIAVAVIGWVAAASLLLGYRLVTTGRVHGESLAYLLLNMFGSIGLGVSTAATHSWPSAVNNLIWLAMGVGPLIRALRILTARRRGPRARAAGSLSQQGREDASMTVADVANSMRPVRSEVGV